MKIFHFCLQAAILQQTAEYIYQLEREKTRYLSQLCEVKRAAYAPEVPAKRRRAAETQGKFILFSPQIFPDNFLPLPVPI